MNGPKFSKEDKAAILAGLLELRRAKKLQGVWYSDSLGVQVRTYAQGSPEYIPWREAAEMVGYRQPKPVPVIKRRAARFKPTLRPINRKPMQSEVIESKRSQA